MPVSHKTFAGIGSRKTPVRRDLPYDVIMGAVARKLVYELGWVMTSGGAEGADTYFQKGLNIEGFDAIGEGLFKLYLPWKGFNGNTRGIVMPHDKSELMHRARAKLIELNVYDKVPRFISYEGEDRNRLTRRELAIATLHTRNVFQVLQESLEDPVNMVICYTPDKATTRAEYSDKTGGTGIAINLADALGKPVFNLARQDHLERICDFIGMQTPVISFELSESMPQQSLF